MTKILLAGGTGCLGRAAYRELLARGYQVRRLVRREPESTDWLADLRRGDSLRGCCDGIEAVISCAGAAMTLHNWRDRSGFREVDQEGNHNLLAEAKRAGVRKFVYVSLAGASGLIRTEYARSHEQFAAELEASGLDWSVVRPTGLYSFLGEVLELARRGYGLVVGDGRAQTNPIHQSDAARACVDALRQGSLDFPVGGPMIYTRRQIVEAAFYALGTVPVIHSIPRWAVTPAPAVLRAVNGRVAALVEFGTAVSMVDCTAPRYGRLTLEDYFRVAARSEPGSAGDNMSTHANRRSTSICA